MTMMKALPHASSSSCSILSSSYYLYRPLSSLSGRSRIQQQQQLNGRRRDGSYICCTLFWPSDRSVMVRKSDCSHFVSVKHCQRPKRKGGVDLLNFEDDYLGKTLIPLRCCLPEGDRRLAREEAKLLGRLDEPMDNQIAFQDEDYCSLLEDECRDDEIPTTTMADGSGRISEPLVPASRVQASSSEMNGSNARVGIWISVGLFVLSTGALVLVDSNILKTFCPPSAGPFLLLSPFILSAAVTAILGYLSVPVLRYIKASQIFRVEGPSAHLVKRGTPTMGGLFFVPAGVATAGIITGFKSTEVQIPVIATLSFFGIGLLDDGLSFWRDHNYGLPGRIKLILQAAVGIILFALLEFTSVSSPNKIKHVVWFPSPFGLVHVGKWYLPLTAFCCAAMSNGVNLTDGLDGLAAGTAAIAFIAMSVTVVPSFPELGIFGSAMAGACFGFLVHNRYKAKVFMGDTGSVPLGGALAVMACQTGMFFPLFIASGWFVIETLSVMGQVLYFKLTKQLFGEGRRWLRMAPFHHHLELGGFKEPVIVTMAYGVSIALGTLASYLVLRRS